MMIIHPILKRKLEKYQDMMYSNSSQSFLGGSFHMDNYDVLEVVHTSKSNESITQLSHQ